MSTVPMMTAGTAGSSSHSRLSTNSPRNVACNLRQPLSQLGQLLVCAVEHLPKLADFLVFFGKPLFQGGDLLRLSNLLHRNIP